MVLRVKLVKKRKYSAAFHTQISKSVVWGQSRATQHPELCHTFMFDCLFGAVELEMMWNRVNHNKKKKKTKSVHEPGKLEVNRRVLLFAS